MGTATWPSAGTYTWPPMGTFTWPRTRGLPVRSRISLMNSPNDDELVKAAMSCKLTCKWLQHAVAERNGDSGLRRHELKGLAGFGEVLTGPEPTGCRPQDDGPGIMDRIPPVPRQGAGFFMRQRPGRACGRCKAGLRLRLVGHKQSGRNPEKVGEHADVVHVGQGLRAV